MTISKSNISYRCALILRLASTLILAACASLPSLRSQVNQTKIIAPANSLPDLRGQAAVEHLKQEGLYDSLAEAMAAARYNSDALASGDAYQFSNPSHNLRATFTSSGARVTSSNGGRDRELTIKLIGYGYGSRMTGLYSRNIVAHQNRIEHEYSQSAIRNPQSAIKEWFVNSEAGIEHGFTLSEPPPTAQDGEEALRVEVEIGGDFEPRLDAAGQVVSFACGRGCGELTYDKLRVYDAREREVAARFELDGRRLAIAVEDGEAEYPVTIDPLFAQQAKLTASDGEAINGFGISVAISGDTVVVGARGANEGRGAAYVFVRDPTTVPPSWNEQAKLTASDGAIADFFGESVAIDGDTVVVGAPTNPFALGNIIGAAYIFVRGGTTWTQQQQLLASDGAEFNEFGGSVAIGGGTVVVGASGADTSKGAAYVFAQSGSTWTQQQKLTASDGAPGDNFGVSVAISGNTVVAGAIFADISGKQEQGAAYVFVRNGTTWSEQQKLTASDGAAFDNFGSSVVVDGDRVVVGAPINTLENVFGQGAAYVFVTIVPGAFVTVSAASYKSPVAPKEIVAGFGSSLANTTAVPSSPPPPTSLAGTSVVVKDSAGVERAAPLYFISPSQINYQIPDGTELGVASVSVFNGTVLVALGAVQIEEFAPSIFALNASGKGPAAALDALTFLPAPFNAELADGEPNFIAVWGTGLGADATDGGGNVFASVTALIDGEEAQVTYAGLAPGFQGANQFNIQLPLGITSGAHTLTISRSTVTSNEVTILIQRE